MGPFSSAVLVVAVYLVLHVMVVPQVKSAPLGFGLLCETDYIDEIFCDYFPCEDESDESDESDELNESDEDTTVAAAINQKPVDLSGNMDPPVKGASSTESMKATSTTGITTPTSPTTP